MANTATALLHSTEGIVNQDLWRGIKANGYFTPRATVFLLLQSATSLAEMRAL